ncbi:MAG: hypothetical protein ACRD3Y_02590, partial [Bryobacteraceae bacterium]
MDPPRVEGDLIKNEKTVYCDPADVCGGSFPDGYPGSEPLSKCVPDDDEKAQEEQEEEEQEEEAYVLISRISLS